MSDYDFSSLNDKEFELLSTDILSSHFDLHIERFKSGKDGGVDGRFFKSPDKEVIVQCKHWIKSGLPALMRSIENTEVEKVRKLNPSRYLFVTSLELSRANKINIKNIFSPYILSDDDIFGNEDLNDFLARFPDIEKKHYKLWITSTNVLQTILNAAIVGRSRFKLEEIIEESNRYVVTQSHKNEMNMLDSKHSIIITGAPGVGKTSLADQLCQYYVAHGYELCFIENSLNEAESHYDEKTKQVFYFDDFLGRNFLLALNNHQDSQVINFISRVKRDPKKRFILTSRSNILNQGKRLSDLFDIKKLDRNEYELSISSLSGYDKAKILYNHIWFSELDDLYVDELYKDKRYNLIIRHDNFNPRLISFITDYHRLELVNHKSYWDYIEKTLGNPQGIWKNVFDVQIDEISKHIVIAVSVHGVSISEKKLKDFYLRLKSSELYVGSNIEFDVVVRLLVGALLNRNVLDSNKVYYNLFNPSIADYVLSTYVDDINYLDELIACLMAEQAVDNIHSLYTSGGVSKVYFSKLIEMQLIRISTSISKYEINGYLISLLFMMTSEIKSPKGDLLKYISDLSEVVLSNESFNINSRYYEVVNWMVGFGVIQSFDLRLKKILKFWINSEDNSYDEFVSLSKLVIGVDPKGVSDITSSFKKEFIEYYSYEITSDAIDSDVLVGEWDLDGCYGSEIVEFVSTKLSDIVVEFDSSEVDEISDCCDIHEIIQANMNANMNDERALDEAREPRNFTVPHGDPIDDLFDRG